MTDTSYWLVDSLGVYAYVTGDDERDRWIPLGWTLAEEPRGNEFVHAWHAGIDVSALQPASALREIWGPRGWEPGPPPAPVNPFNADPPEATRPAVVDEPVPSSRPVAGVVKKEK